MADGIWPETCVIGVARRFLGHGHKPFAIRHQLFKIAIGGPSAVWRDSIRKLAWHLFLSGTFFFLSAAFITPCKLIGIFGLWTT